MNPAALLLLGLLPATVTGSGERSRLQLDLVPELMLLGRTGLDPLTGASDPTTTALGLVRGRATVFLHTVEDDATPVPLQPYLQRIAAVWMTGAVALRSDGRSGTFSGNTLGDLLQGASVDVGAEGWIARMLHLSGDLGLGWASIQGPSQFPSSWPLPPPWRVGAAVGVRSGDLQLDLGYRYQPRADTLPDWFGHQRLPEGAPLRGGGGITLAGRAVLVERIDLQLRMAVSLAGDVYGAFSADYHESRRLGLLWGIDFQHGARTRYTNSTDPDAEFLAPSFRRFGAHFGLSWWWNRRLGITGRYAVEWYWALDPADRDIEGVGQHLSVELSTRI